MRPTGCKASQNDLLVNVEGRYDARVDRRKALTVVRAGSALLVLFAIVVQINTNIGSGTFNPTRFFLFFTILSNLLGSLLYLWLAARWRSEGSVTMDLLRGASAVYLTVTFFVVIALLSGADLQVAVPWVDFVLHKLFPVVVVVDWLVDPPVTRLTFRQALVWLAYPLIWTAFTLARGAIDGWYPYPFLNPANGGYGSVAIVSVAIFVGFLVIVAIMVWLGNFMRDRWPAAQPGR